MGFSRSMFRSGRRILWPGGLLILALLLVIGCGGRGDREITIVHTNDLHGHVLPARVVGWADRIGGYAVFVSWLEGVRAENERKDVPTLVLDAGDIYMGTVEGNLTRGSAVVRLMNRAGYDASAVGNHEFDYGFFNFYQLTREADFPFLSANIFRKESGQLPEFIQPYLVREYDGLKVGIIGVTVNETPKLTAAANVGQVFFGKPADSIRPYVRLLRREGADLLVVLSHLGLEEDRKLAEAVDEIDLIIGGHSHDLLTKPIRAGPRPTLIVQAGSYGRFAGRLDLPVDRLLEEIKAEVGGEYDQVVGIALQDITSADEKDSPLGNLITDAMRKQVDADAAFQNPYGIRADLLRGPVTRRDIYTALPFDNSIVTLDLTGGQIRELLEQSLTLKKGLLQISGLRVEYNPERPEGKRVISVGIGEDPLEEETYYRVATNVFLAGGGDYFSTFTRGINRRDSGVLLRDAVAEYISLNTPLHPGFGAGGRWVRK